jgi:ATP/ADP translocase
MSEKIEKKSKFGWRLASKILAGISGLSIVASCILGFSGEVVSGVMQYIPSFISPVLLNIVIEFTGYGLMIYAMSSECWDFRKEDDKVKFWMAAITLGACIFMYTVCRILKNSIALPSIGQAGTSLGKLVCGITSVAYGIYMTWLNKRFSVRRLLPMLIIPMVGYFVFFFALLKFGLYESVVPSAEWAKDVYQYALGGSLNKVVNYTVIAHWPKFIFYVFSETMAAPMIMSAYQIFNLTVDKKSSKRLLIPLLIFSQFVTMLAGFTFEGSGKGSGSIGYVIEYMGDLKTGNTMPGDSLDNTVVLNGAKSKKEDKQTNISILALAASAIALVLANHVLFMNYKEKDGQITSSKKGPKVPLSVAFKMMIQNKIVLSFVSISVLFAICSSFLEQVWQGSLNKICEDMVKYYYPSQVLGMTEDALKAANKSLYTPLYSTYIIFQGRVTMLLLVGTTRFLSRHLSWFKFSSILPVVLSILSFIYFGILAFGGATASLFGVNIIPIVVILGTAALLFSKSFKVSAGDYGREFAQSYYNDEVKKDIKSAEATFNRMGKTFTSVVFYVLTNLLSLTSLDYRVSMVILVLSAGAAFLWMRSTAIIANDLDRIDALEDQPKVEKSKSEKQKHNKVDLDSTNDSENK